MLGVVLLICLVGNAVVQFLIKDERRQAKLAILLVPFFPTLAAYIWIYPGLMPWNAAGVIVLYPVFHVVFTLASGVSLILLEKIQSPSPPPS
jgi:hypothetical protein